MRAKRSAWIGLGLALSLFVATAPSNSQEVTPSSVQDLDFETAYAEDYDVSKELARTRLFHEDLFNVRLNSLQEAGFPVTGSILQSRKEQSFIIFQADSKLIDDTENEASDLPFPVEVRHATSIDTSELLDAIEPTVSKFFPTWSGMYYSPEQEAVIIEISETDRDGKITPLPDSLPSLVRALQNNFDTLPAIKLESVPEMPVNTGTARGGAAMTDCTSGFTAKKGTAIGILTAAHCTSPQSLYSGPAKVTTSLGSTTANSSLYNSKTDIQFRTIGSAHTISKSFYGSSSTAATTTVLPMMNYANGTTTCTRGTKTGVRCGALTNGYKPNFIASQCGGQTCAATYLRIPKKTEGGDSGGPWYVGGRPLGIQKGGTTTYSVASDLYYRPAGVNLY